MQHDSKLMMSNLNCERTDQLIAAYNISGTWTRSHVGWNVNETLWCPWTIPWDVIYFLKGLSKTFPSDQKIPTYLPTHLPTNLPTSHPQRTPLVKGIVHQFFSVVQISFFG